MKKTKWLIIGIAIIILIALAVISAEYYFNVARSKLISSNIEDIPGTAPNGTYPLVLLHGLNPTYSGRISEYSLKNMQEEISEDLGYVNKGLLTSETTCAELRYASAPISVRATYLPAFELLEIEEYANNVEKIISKVKYCTGAERVDVVTHSMGGIITRYYIKNIDNSSVRKVIMLATPNHGEVYNIGDLAPILIENGESTLHFDFLQLSNNHSFIGNLNQGDETPGDAQYYTIEGASGDGKGDGVVASNSVSIDGETSHEVVECSHMEIKSPSRCPEAYNHVKEFLLN